MAAPTFYPNLLYADAEAAIGWLERTLGFERREVHTDDDGNVVHAEVALDSTVVMLGSAGIGREPFRSLSPGGSLVYVAIDDVDALYGRAREAGADIALELTETDYGSRDFTVRDPEGTLWAFGTYRPAA
jgi:uncharacterized glyoxalase superfamily protein PhnB